MEALETLRSRAEQAVADAPITRRPSWAPPLGLGDELAEICRQKGWLKPDDYSMGRVWARFFDPRDQHRPDWAQGTPHACYSFDFRLGVKSPGRLLIAVRRRYDGGMWSQPGAWHLVRWYPETREPALRRLLALAGSPDAEISIAAKAVSMCMCCFRALTDAISIERGIGPECFGKVTPRKLEAAWAEREALDCEMRTTPDTALIANL